MTRLAAEFWVKAYIKRLAMMNIPAFVTHHGDDTGGAILVKVARLDGTAVLYEKTYDLVNERRHWSAVVSGHEAEVDSWVHRAQTRDVDMWVIEVESPTGVHLLDEM